MNQTILDLSLAFDFSIANTCFKKWEKHLITYKSGVASSKIDFFMVRKSYGKFCLNCKVILGDSLMNQHRVLVKVKIRVERKVQHMIPRITWWKLKGEERRSFIKEFWKKDFENYKEVLVACGRR
ncbi:hypothetical protein Lal_00016236 [Lupinus albus]|nr:hypothetical protein Lal_00016236 [Lupinus albus]